MADRLSDEVAGEVETDAAVWVCSMVESALQDAWNSRMACEEPGARMIYEAKRIELLTQLKETLTGAVGAELVNNVKLVFAEPPHH